MNTIAERAKYKSPEQVEFADLVAGMGWKPADVARELGYSKAWVSYVLDGKRNVTQRTLVNLRRIVAERLGQQGETSKDSGRFPPTEHYVIDDSARKEAGKKLDDLAKEAPRSFDSVKQVIDAMHQQARANSDRKVEAALEGIMPMVMRRAKVPLPPWHPESGQPTTAPAPASPSDQGSDAQPTSAGQAPKKRSPKNSP